MYMYVFSDMCIYVYMCICKYSYMYVYICIFDHSCLKIDLFFLEASTIESVFLFDSRCSWPSGGRAAERPAGRAVERTANHWAVVAAGRRPGGQQGGRVQGLLAVGCFQDAVVSAQRFGNLRLGVTLR